MAISFDIRTKRQTAAFRVEQPGEKTDFHLGDVRVIEVDRMEKYEGAYRVVSKVSTEQTLPTKGKQMVENMTILKVPQVEVANTSGGNTLIIGDDYYA